MSEAVGIKETKECLVGLLKVASLMAASFKDGIQAQDISVVLGKIVDSPELKNALVEAYNGIDKVPAEIKDINLVEGLELITVAIPELLKIVSSIKA